MKNATSVGTRHTTALAAGLLLALGTSPTAAQGTVWRCGNSYSQQPCEGARRIELDDERNEGQRAQARQAAVVDAQLARQLEHTRLEDEARMADYMPFVPEPLPELPAAARTPPQVFKARVPGELRRKVAKAKRAQAARVQAKAGR